MNSTTNTDKITDWLSQCVDAAFAPLLEKIAQGGTPVQWKKEGFARTLCMQFPAGEVTYAIMLDPDSDPVAGQILLKTPEAESCKSFAPALQGEPHAPGEMTGPDLVNDLIDRYGHWCKRQAVGRATTEHEVHSDNRTPPASR